MKRVLVAAAVVVGVVGMAMVAGAFTDRTNTCTGTTQINGYVAVASGLDTAIVRVLTSPVIAIAKWATNVRTSVTDANMVVGVSGDSINFMVIWSNTGEADADTMILTDYIPAGLTVGSVLTNTGSAGVTVQAASYTAAGFVGAYNTVQGTIAGPDNGQVVFSMRVN